MASDRRWAGILALLLGLSGASAAAVEPTWDYVVHVPAGPHEPWDVEWTLHGFDGRMRLCADEDGAGRYVSRLRLLAATGDQALERDQDDDDCWWVAARASEPVRLAYRFDFPGLVDRRDDPDSATRAGDGVIFTDNWVLLRPDPMDFSDTFTVQFSLPPKWSVAAPWNQLSAAPIRFQTTGAQLEGGSYVAVGPLRPLGEVAVRGGAYDLTLMGDPAPVTPDMLEEWVRRAGSNVAELYHGLPAPRVEILLVPQHGSSEAGMFGTTFHHEHPSLVMYFSTNGKTQSFADDWLPAHELFHLGNPELVDRVPWFVEGVATYYQDVLRGRSRQRDPLIMWGDFYDQFTRFCDPDGMPLAQESRELRQHHHYQRLYWGGACLFFRADVAIRAHSNGKQSIDDVVRDLMHRSHEEPLTEEQLVEAIDRAAGAPVARDHLSSTKSVGVKELFKQLGVVPTGPDTVVLHDDAPLAWIRKQIF